MTGPSANGGPTSPLDRAAILAAGESLANERAPQTETERAAQTAAEKTREARTLLAPWTLAKAVERLEARHARQAAAAAHGGGMRWPGCPPGSPADDDPTRACGRLVPSGTTPVPPWSAVRALLGSPHADWLAVLIGRTGRGKSGCAITVALASGLAGVPVVYASCEMGEAEVAARLLANRADPPPLGAASTHDAPTLPVGGPPWVDVLRGPPRVDAADLRAAADSLVSGCPAFYVWAPKASKERTVEGLQAVVEAVASVHGTAPFVVLDYVQRLAGGGDDRRGAVSTLSGALRDITRPSDDYPGAGMLVLSSTARSHYGTFRSAADLLRAYRGGFRFSGRMEQRKGKPAKPGREYVPPIDLEGLGKESGELEYDASVVLCLTCDPDDPHGEASFRVPRDPMLERAGYRRGILVVAKNRSGVGSGWMPVSFHGASGRWEAPRGGEVGASRRELRRELSKSPGGAS